jgi:hypothetical protein
MKGLLLIVRAGGGREEDAVAVTSGRDDLDGAAGACCGLSSDHHLVRTPFVAGTCLAL